MPRYDYRCTDCGEELEVVQSFTDDPLTECPNCQGKLRKVFSPIGIAFKGSGFYKTDSRSSSGTSSSKAPSSSSSGGDSTSSGDSGSSKDGNGSTSTSSSSDSGSKTPATT